MTLTGPWDPLSPPNCGSSRGLMRLVSAPDLTPLSSFRYRPYRSGHRISTWRELNGSKCQVTFVRDCSFRHLGVKWVLSFQSLDRKHISSFSVRRVGFSVPVAFVLCRRRFSFGTEGRKGNFTFPLPAGRRNGKLESQVRLRRSFCLVHRVRCVNIG